MNIGLLVLVKVIGDDSNGATRWVEIAGLRFQPSELAKIIIILFFAYFFMKHQEQLNTVKILGLSFILAGIPLVLIKEQPDLSTTIVTGPENSGRIPVQTNYGLAAARKICGHRIPAVKFQNGDRFRPIMGKRVK